jgi:hypothetical protein
MSMTPIPGRYLKRTPDGAIFPWTEARAAKPNFVEHIVPEPQPAPPADPATDATVTTDPVAPAADDVADAAPAEDTETLPDIHRPRRTRSDK